MTSQKSVKYNSLIKTGQKEQNEYELKLNVLEQSANYLIHKDILRHRTAQTQGTVSTKTRSEVRGGGQKPWKQKGTGRARAGSNRSPLWKGGGVIFGPKPQQTILKLNKKERQLALQTLLYNKRKSIWILDNFEDLLNQPKTKTVYNYLTDYKVDLNLKTLIIVYKQSIHLKLSIRNIKNIELISITNLNTLSLLKAKQIILTLPALKELKETYGN